MSSGTNIGSPSIRKVDFNTNFISAVASLPVGAYANALAVDASGQVVIANAAAAAVAGLSEAALCQRRLAREPLAYITGNTEFFGLSLSVDARVETR